MPDWIAVSKIGKYAQGDITPEILQELVDTYDPNFMAAPFIPDHRKFDDKGEMITNHSALGWIQAVSTDGTYLYVMPEEENHLSWYYDGTTYRYASIEIEVVRKNEREPEQLYLAAVAVTNFPAAKIPQIKMQKFDRKKEGAVLFGGYNKIEFKQHEDKMNKEQLIKLNKILGLPEESKAEDAITKLSEVQKKLEAVDELKEFASQFGEMINVISQSGTSTSENGLEAKVEKLASTVEALTAKLSKTEEDKLEAEIDKAIADKKFLPSQKEDLLKSYAGRVEDFKSFAEKQPVLNINNPITLPKKEDGSALTYKDLLNDPKKYMEVKESNPALFNQLRAEWQANPNQ